MNSLLINFSSTAQIKRTTWNQGKLTALMKVWLRLQQTKNNLICRFFSPLIVLSVKCQKAYQRPITIPQSPRRFLFLNVLFCWAKGVADFLNLFLIVYFEAANSEAFECDRKLTDCLDTVVHSCALPKYCCLFKRYYKADSLSTLLCFFSPRDWCI